MVDFNDFGTLADELNAAVRGSSNILSGLTRGGNAGSTIIVTLSSGEQIGALALTRVDAGTCFALKTDQGQYYVLPSTTDVTKRVNVKNYRQTRKQDELVDTTKYKPKVGYVYSQMVNNSTPIVCGSSVGDQPPGQSSYGMPNYTPNRYYPVPEGQTRRIHILVHTTGLYTFIGSGCNLNSTRNEPVNYTQEYNLVFGDQDFLNYETRSFTRNDATGVYTNGTQHFAQSSLKSNDNFYLAPVYTSGDYSGTSYYDLAPGGATNCTVTETAVDFNSSVITISDLDGQPLNPPPPDSPVPDDPNAPPPATTSYEFYYKSDKSTNTVKLKKLATDQLLEAKPYIIHQSSSLSYVILKYGNAGNDGGSSDNWCKLSLFKIKGSRTLSMSETVYSWTQESVLKNLLKKYSYFSDIIGSKQKVADINLNAAILDGKLKCLSHRNLSNFIKGSDLSASSVFDVFIVDPALTFNTNLDKLTTDSYYTDLTQIKTDLVTNTSITATLRYFEVKPNPNFSGVANCLTNPQYSLTEKTNKKIKNFKIKGLNSSDTSIKILTLNCGYLA